jgi:RsmE family RNA methyltransferase
MNLILLHAPDFIAANRVRLTDRRLAHIRAVHRASIGDALRVGEVDGRLGLGVVTTIDDTALEMTIRLDREPPPAAPVRLVLALPRPKVLRRILQCIAAIGVKDVVLCNAYRVEKSYWASPTLTDEAMRLDLLLGLEQGGDTMLPRVTQERLFKPFVEDRLTAFAAGTRRLLAHPRPDSPCPRGVTEPMTVAVGPEGGFIQYELDALVAQGFEPVSLGPRPLRVEHAVAALLGRLL